MSYRSSNRGDGRKHNRGESRNQEAPPQSRVAGGSVGAVEMPSIINIHANSASKHTAWSKIQKQFSDYFVFYFEYYDDIITTGAHHVFGAPPRMTVEENDEILNIPIQARYAELAWQMANPNRLDEFQEHGTHATDFAKALMVNERKNLDQRIIDRQHTYNKDKESYLKNGPKVFLFILNKCSDALKAKLGLDPDWLTQNTITKDPCWLWNAIEQVIIGLSADIDKLGDAVNDQMLIMETVGLKATFDQRKQHAHEKNEEFFEWFTDARKGLEAVGIVIDEAVAASQFIGALNNNQHLQLKDYLYNQLYTVKQNIYPKTVPDAYKLATSYKQHSSNSNQQLSSSSQSSFYTEDSEDNRKMSSTTDSHVDKTCDEAKSNYSNNPSSKRSTPNDKGGKVVCEHCGLTGHSMDACYGKDLPSKQARVNAQKYLRRQKKRNEKKSSQSKDEDDNRNKSPKKEVKKNFFTNSDCYDGADNSDDEDEDYGPKVICDSGANIGLYNDKSLLYNIRTTSEPLVINGINGESLKCYAIATSKITQNTVYFHEDAATNVECYYDLIDIAVNWSLSDDGMTYLFYMKCGNCLEFQCDRNEKMLTLTNIYTEKDRHINDIIYMTTVRQNMKDYSKQEIKKATLARTFQDNMGISITAFKLMVSHGCISDLPFTMKDIERAELIYGPSAISLKGRTKDAKHKEHVIKPSDKSTRKELNLYIDIMFIAGYPFMLAINSIGYVLVKKMKSRNAVSCRDAIDRFIAVTISQDFTIVKICSDAEKGVYANEEHFGRQGIKIDVFGKGSHVAIIERQIQNVKSHSRTIANGLAFPLTLVLLTSLVNAAVFTVNCIPQFSKQRSESPREMFTGQKLHFRQILGKFGDYALVNVFAEIKNNLQPRVLDCLYLYPVGDSRGSAKFLDLNTGAVITRGQFKILPMPQHIFDTIKLMSKKEDLGIGIKLQNWRQSKDVSEEEEESFTDSVETEFESTQIEDLSKDLDFDVDVHMDENYDAGNEPERDNVTLQEVSDNMVDDYNPTFSYDPEVDEFLKNTPYWEQDSKPSSSSSPSSLPTTHSDEFTFTQPVNSDIFATYKKAKKGNITPKQGMALGEIGESSMKKELKSMLDLKVWVPIYKSDIEPTMISKIIRSRMFLKEKRDGTIKSRLVAGGHMQDKSLYSVSNTSSPTVSTDALLILLSLYTSKDVKIKTIDIVSAYLNCDLEKKVYMTLDNMMSSLLIQIDPTYIKYYNHDKGVIHVMLKKALYGLVESARLFYDALSDALLKYGFIRNPYDQCVYNYTSISQQQLTVCFHVDDLLCVSENSRDLEELSSYLKTQFIDITVSDGLIHDYLGMIIDFTEKGYCKLDMSKYMQKILDYAHVANKAKTPAEDSLYHINDESELLGAADKAHFHSVVACILYPAKRARPDLLTAVSFLTTRVLYSTVEDWNKLARLLGYINNTKNTVMRLSCHGGAQVGCYVDASFSNHPDCKSTSGCVITLGSGAVHCKSTKQSLVTKSSTEAELVAISDCISIGIWARNFLIEQNGKGKCFLVDTKEIPPVILFQDNTSTITLINKGRSTSTRTRHVNIRYFFIHDRIVLGEVMVVYKETGLMIADYMTKPLQGRKFLDMRKMLLDHVEDKDEDNKDLTDDLEEYFH